MHVAKQPEKCQIRKKYFFCLLTPVPRPLSHPTPKSLKI